jgi:hypothetical protein
MVLVSFPRCVDSLELRVGRGEEPSGKNSPPDSDPFSDAEFGKNLASVSNQFAASPNHGFQFYKRSQLFIRMHNETLSVAAMCVSNPDRSPFEINS